MDSNTKEILRKAGWSIECFSPLEVKHHDGSFASGQAAQMVIDTVIADRNDPAHPVPAESFCQTLQVNVENTKLDDAGFRQLVRNTLPIVDYPRVGGG